MQLSANLRHSCLSDKEFVGFCWVFHEACTEPALTLWDRRQLHMEHFQPCLCQETTWLLGILLHWPLRLCRASKWLLMASRSHHQGSPILRIVCFKPSVLTYHSDRWRMPLDCETTNVRVRYFPLVTKQFMTFFLIFFCL